MRALLFVLAALALVAAKQQFQNAPVADLSSITEADVDTALADVHQTFEDLVNTVYAAYTPAPDSTRKASLCAKFEAAYTASGNDREFIRWALYRKQMSEQ